MQEEKEQQSVSEPNSDPEPRSQVHSLINAMRDNERVRLISRAGATSAVLGVLSGILFVTSISIDRSPILDELPQTGSETTPTEVPVIEPYEERISLGSGIFNLDYNPQVWLLAEESATGADFQYIANSNITANVAFNVTEQAQLDTQTTYLEAAIAEKLEVLQNKNNSVEILAENQGTLLDGVLFNFTRYQELFAEEILERTHYVGYLAEQNFLIEIETTVEENTDQEIIYQLLDGIEIEVPQANLSELPQTGSEESSDLISLNLADLDLYQLVLLTAALSALVVGVAILVFAAYLTLPDLRKGKNGEANLAS